MSKASELREMNDEQLDFALREAKQELFRLQFQASTEKLDAPSNLMKLRREIARIKTIQHERKYAAALPSEHAKRRRCGRMVSHDSFVRLRERGAMSGGSVNR